MTDVWTPERDRPRLRVDTPVDRILRDRLLDRIDALAADFLDEAAEAALAGNPKRTRYLEGYWSDRLAHAREHVAAEPLLKALLPIQMAPPTAAAPSQTTAPQPPPSEGGR